MSRVHGSLVRLVLFGLLALSLAAAPADARPRSSSATSSTSPGPTSDQGKDIAQGRIDAVQYFNEHGGINGRKIELVSVEYGFQPPRAVAAYKEVRGAGQGPPRARVRDAGHRGLRPFITKDKMPYLSARTPGI